MLRYCYCDEQHSFSYERSVFAADDLLDLITLYFGTSLLNVV